VIITAVCGTDIEVDPEDWIYLRLYSWQILTTKCGKQYARRTEKLKGKSRTLLMHRQIMKPDYGFVVDHINGDTLNNRRFNLRICTQSQNLYNRRTPRTKGVGFHKGSRRFRAYINVDKRPITLGYFKTVEEAIESYNQAALKYHGEYAVQNRVEE